MMFSKQNMGLIIDYIRHSKANHNPIVHTDTLGDMWQDMVKQWGLIGAILTLPFYIVTILIGILLSPLLLAIIVMGFFVYMIPSILIGGFIDLSRQIIVREKDDWFKKWKYTDKIFNWWELTPYGMSPQGYVDFKKNRILSIKIEEVFDEYWDSKIDRVQAEIRFQALKQSHMKENDVKDILNRIDSFKKILAIYNGGGIVDSQKINLLKSEAKGCLGWLM